MTTPLFHLTTPNADEATRVSPLQTLLEWLTRVNQWHIARSVRRMQKGLERGAFPPLYASRVERQERPVGSRSWLDAPAVLMQGRGTDEDLVAWRAAELRVAGIKADPAFLPTQTQGRNGERSLRPVVLTEQGIEDPGERLSRRSGARRSPGIRMPDPGDVLAPLVHLSLPDTDDDAHFAPLQIALEGLTQVNELQLREAAKQGMPLPALYDAGVRYREEAPGHEDWLDIEAVIAQGFADCEDLAAWRTAELRVAGIPAEPVIKYQWIPRDLMIKQGYPAEKLPARGVWLVHCCVRWPDGSIEDPSKILGMGGEYMEKI